MTPRLLPDDLPCLAPFHPDEEALLRSCLESPEDDAPRLILADWYDENGLSQFAEYIRFEVTRRFDQPTMPLPEQANQWACKHIHNYLIRQNSLRRSNTLEIQFVRGLPCRLALTNSTPSLYTALLNQQGPWLTDFLWYGANESNHRWLHDEWVKQLRTLSIGRITNGYYQSSTEPSFDYDFFRDLTITNRVFEHLTAFSLWGTQLNESVTRPLLQNFPSQVRELDLSDNQLSVDWYVQFLKCPWLGSVQKLTLSSSRLNDRFCRSLARSTQLSNLQYLLLGWNKITANGVLAILESPNLPKLEYIDVRYNKITRMARSQLVNQTINPKVQLRFV